MQKPKLLHQIRAIALSFALVAPITLATPASANEEITCNDLAATIVSSDPIIYGTDGPDVIVVQGEGRHKVLAGKGADVICGTDFRDRINGGAGPDRIYGAGGVDYLIGASGRDTILAGPGNDLVFGGPARDAINGQDGADSIDSGIGINFCAGDLSDIVVGDCTIDQLAPAVFDVTIPTSVEAGSTATFSWKTSDASGVYYTGAYLGGNSGWITDWCGFPVEPTLVAGDNFEGTYQVDCVISPNAVNGTYTFAIISSDVVSQATYQTYNFEVVGGIADNLAPELVSMTAPEFVNAGENFTVNFELGDESGVESVYAYIAGDGFFVDITTGLLYAEALDWPTEPISGDRFNGVWQQTFKMMDYAPAGTYTIWYGTIDVYGNRKFEPGVTFSLLG